MEKIRVEGFDVVVVGYGAAGAVAAIEAARAGARVLLTEKMPDPGGVSILSAGGLRICDDVEQAFRYLRHTCGGRTPDDILRVLAEGMATLPAYLRGLAAVNQAEIKVDPHPGNYPFPGSDSLGYAEVASIPGFGGSREKEREAYLAVQPMRPGCYLFKLLADNVDALVAEGRITVWLNSAAQRLLPDAQGVVSGVSILRAADAGEGEAGLVEVDAPQGVILACGGFEADDSLKKQFLVSTPALTGSFRGNTGDGIRMAQKVGAALWHMWLYHGPYGMRHHDPDYPFGLYVKMLPMWTPERRSGPLPRMAWIIVDQLAQRYANEYPPYLSDTGVRQFDHYDADRYTHTRLPSFLIFDEEGRKMYPMGRSITNDREARYEWSADNLKEVGNGILVKADTIEALAEKLELDPQVLRATIERWNQGVSRGEDADFGRPAETMVPLRTGPFYAARLWPLVINTQGGPMHDAQQRVLDAFGEPIPGLYSAGELGSVFGHVYMAGGNLAECFVGGRIAARSACAGLVGADKVSA